MKSLRHILLGIVIAAFLFCSFGFYDSWNFTDSNNRLVRTYNGQKALSMYTTCASTNTSTSFEPVVFDTVLTGAGQVGGRVLSKLTTNVKLGSWATAFKAYLDFDETGAVHGLGSAMLGELRLPAANLDTLGAGSGTYSVLELELVTQNGGTTGSHLVSFNYMQVSGNQTATDDWEDYGCIWNIQGLTDAPGNVFDTDADPTTDATLRIRINSTWYYILLSNDPLAA